MVVGLKFVPQIQELWLTDLFTNIPIIMTSIYIPLIDGQAVLSLCRIGQTLTIAYILRSVSMLVTGLPDPRPTCQRVTANFFTSAPLHRCGGTTLQ